MFYMNRMLICRLQFNVDGTELLSAAGEFQKAVTVSTGGQTVLFSFTGDLIPAGSGVLTLTLAGGSACLSDLVLSGADGLTIAGSEVLDCSTLSYSIPTLLGCTIISL